MPSNYPKRERSFQADAREVAELWKHLPDGVTPPSDVATEQSLLGAVMIDKSSAETAVTLLGNPPMADSPFYEERHATIWKAIAHKASIGEDVDLITVKDFLAKHGKLEQCGGAAYLVELTSKVVTTVNVKSYCYILLEKRLGRDLLIHTLKAQAELYNGNSVFDVQSGLENTLDTLRSGVRQDRVQPKSIGPLLSVSLQEAAAAAGDTGIPGIPIGLRGVDDMIGGLLPGDLSILAARPSTGKTACAVTIAKNICGYPVESKRVGVGFFSIEMTKKKIALRFLSCEAQVSSNRIRKNELTDYEYNRLMDAMKRMEKWPIMIQDDPRTTALDIRSQLRALQRHGCGIAIVDYLQILKTTQAGETREREVNEITQQLKDTAKLLNIHVMALAQLNRGAEMGGKARPPQLSDLRECLAGDSLVLNADTGERIPVRRIVEEGLRFKVWAIDGRRRFCKQRITAAWEAGEKPIVTVVTKTGRRIRCSAKHRFYGVDGWRTLDTLRVGESIGVPRAYERTGSASLSIEQAHLLGLMLGNGYFGGSPALTCANRQDAIHAEALAREGFGLRPYLKAERNTPDATRVIFTTGKLCGAGKNPMTTWLRSMGLWGKRAHDKFIPDRIFLQPPEVVAAVLRGLFHADGTYTGKVVKLCSVSERMIREAQHLLLRLGVLSYVRSDKHSPSGLVTHTDLERIWTLIIHDSAHIARFMEQVGFLWAKHERAATRLKPQKQNDAGTTDRIPLYFNDHITRSRKLLRLSHAKLGWRDQGKCISRERLLTVGKNLQSDFLIQLATSDVTWDEIARIETGPEEMTYDVTVDSLHSFCVDDFVTHNSGAIEQIADVVMFIHRPQKGEWFDNGEPCKLIVAKDRDGPTGEVDLKVFPYYSLFEDGDSLSVTPAGTTSAPPAEYRNYYEPERESLYGEPGF